MQSRPGGDKSTETPAPRGGGPVRTRDRILELDVLRGLALLGVLVANVWMWFSGLAFRFPDYHGEAWSGSLDSVAYLLVGHLVHGKAIATFSILFGIGFGLQMERAEPMGAAGSARLIRRLLVLLALGLGHGVLLWYGDILATYALFGFTLFFFWRRDPRIVLASAVGLIVLPPLIIGTAMKTYLSLDPSGTAALEGIQRLADANRERLALFQSGEWGRVIEGNLQMLRRRWLDAAGLNTLPVLGQFLIGVWILQRGVLLDVIRSTKLLRRGVLWGGSIGGVGTVAHWQLQRVPPVEAALDPILPFAIEATRVLGTVPLALGYIAATTLLLSRAPWRRVLAPFGPVGRMALTNYLLQSLIAVPLFYSSGWVGTIRPSAALGVALLLFGAQTLFSHWWLARFRYGPAEWAWRSLTYLERQPMRAQ